MNALDKGVAKAAGAKCSTDIRIAYLGQLRTLVLLRRLLLQVAAANGGLSQAQVVSFWTWTQAVFELPESTSRHPLMPDSEFWNLLGGPLKRDAGRPVGPMTIALIIDLQLLTLCGNAYAHLLRDALRLRLTPYKTKLERRRRLSREVKWAVTTCRRVWMGLEKKDPPAVPVDWWRREERLLWATLEAGPPRKRGSTSCPKCLEENTTASFVKPGGTAICLSCESTFKRPARPMRIEPVDR